MVGELQRSLGQMFLRRRDGNLMPLALPALMRQNTTANIARSLQTGARPTRMPPLTMPPVQQPPLLPPERTTPILPDPSATGTFNTPEIRNPLPAQPGFNPANPTNMAAQSYLALMRSAGRPVPEHIDPIYGDPSARQLGDEPALPVGGGPPDPVSEIDPSGTIPVGNYDPSIYHDFFQGDPRYPGGHNPTTGPQVVVTPPDSGMTHGVDIDGNPVDPPIVHTPRVPVDTGGPRNDFGPLFSGNNHIPNIGGLLGHGTNTTPQEPWYGKLARYLPYIGPVASIAHPILDYARRHGPGTVGGPAHVVGSKPKTVTGPTVAHPTTSLPTSGLLSPEAYRQATWGGVTPTGYRDPHGSAAWDQHANMMQLMNSTSYGGAPNRNLVSDRLNEQRSIAPFAAHGNSMARRNAFMALYGNQGVHTNAAMMGGG